MARRDTVEAAHSLVSSERAKIMEPPSIGLRLNYTRVRARVSYVRHACAHTHSSLRAHTISSRLITRMLSRLSQRRRWRSHEQQSNDKPRQRAKHGKLFQKDAANERQRSMKYTRLLFTRLIWNSNISTWIESWHYHDIIKSNIIY